MTLDQAIVKLYVEVGNNRLRCLLMIVNLYADNDKPPPELLAARDALSQAHEGMKPMYKRACERLFEDIPH